MREVWNVYTICVFLIHDDVTQPSSAVHSGYDGD